MKGRRGQGWENDDVGMRIGGNDKGMTTRGGDEDGGNDKGQPMTGEQQ